MSLARPCGLISLFIWFRPGQFRKQLNGTMLKRTDVPALVTHKEVIYTSMDVHVSLSGGVRYSSPVYLLTVGTMVTSPQPRPPPLP